MFINYPRCCLFLSLFLLRSPAWRPPAPSARSSIRSWTWRCATPLPSRCRWAPIKRRPRPAWRCTVCHVRCTTASTAPALMTTSTTARTQRWMDISILTRMNRQLPAHCFSNSPALFLYSKFMSTSRTSLNCFLTSQLRTSVTDRS